jgi:tetraacyldisaccharide 4'-kinase
MRPQPWLAPLAPVYGAVVATKNAACDRMWLRSGRLEWPVVSIGNLSTGGTGKTPLTIALARLLKSAGIAVDVLSRGYGRAGGATLQVGVHEHDAAERFGDEPVLIARSAEVPVFVGRSRHAAGLLAERTLAGGPRIHLLDDGFQHRQLARDLDIVLLHRSDFGARLLPAGSLREPLSSLGRAQAVVLREEDRDFAARTERYLRPGAQLWSVHRTLCCADPPRTAVAFCGIARPEEFFAGLRALGVELAETIAYPDHHRYGPADLERLVARLHQSRSGGLVTTEKDAARLGAAARAHLERSGALKVAALEVGLLDPDRAVDTIRSLLDGRDDWRVPESTAT